MQRQSISPTFTDLAVMDLGSPKAQAFFDRCLKWIPFDELAATLVNLFPAKEVDKGGRPHWPVVMMLKTGTLIDATIIEAPLGGKRADGSSSGDSCASKTSKGGRSYNGYRAHIATDRNGIITDFVYDTASVSEHEHFDPLARNETKAIYADSGCRSQTRVEEYREKGVVPAICHRRVKGQATLTQTQKRMNQMIAPIRAFVEHPFGWIKCRLNNRRTRYRGVRRNGLDFALSATFWNWCRSLSLRAA